MDLAAWRDLSLIWLSFLAFILGVVPLALLYFVVRGMLFVNRKVPRYLKLGQHYSSLVRDQTRKYSLLVAEPVTKAHGQAARVEAVLRHLTPQPNHVKQGHAKEEETNP